MRLLLDTNILLPIVNERFGQIESRLREPLLSTEAVLFVSVASFWEIAIKVHIGKLELAPPLSSLPELVVGLGMSIVNIGPAHALTFAEPEPDTKDPFDRLLLNQCLVENFRLVTTDRKLAVHPLAWR